METPTNFVEQLLRSPKKWLKPEINAWHEYWWLQYGTSHSAFRATVLTGFHSDRIAGAFTGAYQSALRKLLPSERDNPAMLSFCITEEGGNKPSDIRSQLVAKAGIYSLSGAKKWSSLGSVSSELLVAARRNSLDEKLAELVLVRVQQHTKGLVCHHMPETAFTPEIPHCRLEFNEITIAETAVFPGDAYTQYIKPFRFIEDCMVTAAIAACLLRIAKDSNWPPEQCIELVAILALLESAQQLAPDSPVGHLYFEQASQQFEKIASLENTNWQRVDSEIRARWERDSAILNIARFAAGIRQQRALSELGLTAGESQHQV